MTSIKPPDNMPVRVYPTDAEMAERIRVECGFDEGDIEIQHDHADQLLVDLLQAMGYEQTVAAWGEVPKWYS